MIGPPRFAWVALALAAGAVLPARARGQVPRLDPPLVKTIPRVLVYTVSAGFVHDVVKREAPDKPSIVEQALIDLGRDTNHFEAVLSRDAADFTRENLARYALVFFYTTGELPFTKEQRDALFEFVKQGGAFAGVHCATDTFYAVPEYGAMIGAYFDGHPWHEKVKIKVEDRDHPATKHLGPSFEITDEIYQFKAPYDRRELHVLLSLDTTALDLKKDGIHRADHDFANAWCKDFGKGRVFYTALGHSPELWKDERFLKHVDGGLRWAMRTVDEPADAGAKTPGGEKKPPPKEEKKGALPLVPDGFAIDLIAEAPEILWPSVVHSLPDGSILVGEDRMDMPGPTDQPLDRILHITFNADGTIAKRVFADRLFATFGMEEIDGDVYVMNMPHLTRLRDTDGDGVADERKEILTDLGPPAPGWPGGFNDHIVSGIRLGIDGFLYIAVGDKGIPRAHGTDGSTLTLRGGGVIRVRPDGSRLQVVASGLRNILDVAIDARGEMFTYDNTDDGLGWWTRITHVIAGGYYGYPWDYHAHQDRMLPCMKDYGGGSPCGGLVYREAAWPKEFQGSLFYCEWAKGVLRRFDLEPERNTTFKVKTDEDFARAGDVKNFRPLNVRESPDGRFLYVTDWAFDGWTQPTEAGRLWRIRRADDDPRVASAARPLPESVDALVEALGDASFNHRLRAQRELVRRGPAALAPLRALFASDALPRARIHALWALVEIDPAGSRELLKTGLSERQIELRVQVVRAIGQCSPDAGELLSIAFADPNPRIKREVFSAIALASDDVVARLAPALEALFKSTTPLFGTLPGQGDPFLHFGLIRALRKAKYVPDVAACKERAQAFELLRDRFEPAVVAELESVASNEAIEIVSRVTTLGMLAELCKKPPPWDGKWWNIQPAKSGPPARTVAWEETDAIQHFLRARLADRAPNIRRAALEAVRDTSDTLALADVRAQYAREPVQNNRRLALDVLAALRDEGSAELLGAIVRDTKASQSLREHAVETASAIRTPAMVDLLCDRAGDDAAGAGEVVPCLHALGRLKEKRASALCARRSAAGVDEIRVAAIAAWVEIDGRDALSKLEPLLADSSASVRRAVIRAYGELAVPATALLLPLVGDEATRADAIEALALSPDAGALSAYLLGLSSATASVRDASTRAIGALRESVRAEVIERVERHALDEKTLAVLRSIYTEPQPIVRWKLLGPFARDASQPRVIARNSGTSAESPRESAAFEIDARRVDTAARTTGLDGVEVAWTDCAADAAQGFVDLEIAVAKKSNAFAFAAGEIASARERQAEIRVGSDDTVSVWLNGELVHDFDGNRAWKADEDRFPVRLNAGSNSILLRIGNGAGQWSFNAKVSGDPTGPLFESAASPPTVDLRAFALEHPGDPGRGYKLFREHPGVMCIRCHTVHGAGAQVGPDLSDVAAKYSKEDIITSVLQPSARIAEGYKAVTLELRSGVLVSGLVKRESDDEVILFDTNGEEKRVEKADVQSRTASNVSLMPEGQATLLSKEEFSDLIAYLATLRGSPAAKRP